MKKFISAMIVFLIAATATEAALPPAYQSIKEYRALLDSPELIETIGSAEPIKSIIRNDNDFMIKTNKHTLQVDVVYDPTDRPGPAKFHLVFHSLE